ncbi:MAG: DUF309 domain-containing protein [Polyangiales bacterium]
MRVTDEPFAAGTRLFDEGAFFEAHEAWEERWRTEQDEARRRELQGLIQVAAAFHKLLVMKSPESALRLLERGLAKLDGFDELTEFRRELQSCATAIAEGRFEPSSIPSLG